jgi:iterative type I PKS product template protein
VAGVGQELSNPHKNTPVVFVFSGQGGHYAGMGKDLFRASGQFRGIIADLERICDSLGFPSFANLIADQDTTMESISIVQLHLSLVALEIALTKLWELYGIKPDLVMGHSIGEYAALCAAGVLSIFDTLYLVGKRAQLLESKCVAGTHAMLSISGIANEVSLFLSEGDLKGCEVSCFNGPGMAVLSGEQQEILLLETLLKKRGLKCQLLDIPYGMHSCQMDAISLELEDILGGVQFSKPKIKMISTFLGHQVTEASSFRGDHLIRHTREPVKFQQAVASCISQGIANASSLWLEIGPNASCLGLVRANINVKSSLALTSLRKGENNWKTISANLATFYMAKQTIHWRAFHNDFIDNLSHIDLPKYAFDTRDFWITYKSNDQGSRANCLVTGKEPEPEPISTCLHRCVKRVDDEHQQSASFISTISHPSLSQIVEGHKLCGIAVCSAGVFIDMALTAARHLITGGNFAAPCPALLVCDLKVDRAVVPTSESPKVIRIEVTRKMCPGTEFSVSFSDDSGSSPPAFANCLVRLRDQSIFDIETQKQSFSIQLKIAKLMDASEAGLADRIRGKVFYKLFSNLMEYSKIFKGVESAVVSDDFRELIAIVHFPAHDERRLDQRFTSSPYWSDILGQTLGFLLNGNPNQAGDYVYIATHIERLDLHVRDFSPDVRYQVHACINHSDESGYRGNAYILYQDVVVGLLEGLRFHRMPRKTLLHSLEKANAPQIKNSAQGKTPEAPVKSNGGPAGPAVPGGLHKVNGHAVSLATIFRQILLDETRLLGSEVVPSASFSELGVDSIFSISILAALKAETGIELGTSFLTENPTFEDAERALRIIENQHSTSANSNGLTNGHTDGDEAPNIPRESNIVLLSGSTHAPSRTSLFLITDGVGSAAAYVHLPKFANDLQVFALESPWVKDPMNFNCTFSEAAEMYLVAIRTKQPRGPYLLGGWSGGSVFAYEVSRLLLEAGERVIGLIIIDMLAPRPFNRSKVAMPTLNIIEHMGMLSGIDLVVSDVSASSLQMKEHMLSTVRCFSRLNPTPMAVGYRPDATFVIWATELIGPESGNNWSINLGGQNLDAWFYPSQHDFGPNGWGLLVGDKVECFQIQGDHFSIMKMPNVSSLNSSSNFDRPGDGK